MTARDPPPCPFPAIPSLTTPLSKRSSSSPLTSPLSLVQSLDEKKTSRSYRCARKHDSSHFSFLHFHHHSALCPFPYWIPSFRPFSPSSFQCFFFFVTSVLLQEILSYGMFVPFDPPRPFSFPFFPPQNPLQDSSISHLSPSVSFLFPMHFTFPPDLKVLLTQTTRELFPFRFLHNKSVYPFLACVPFFPSVPSPFLSIPTNSLSRKIYAPFILPFPSPLDVTPFSINASPIPLAPSEIVLSRKALCIRRLYLFLPWTKAGFESPNLVPPHGQG